MRIICDRENEIRAFEPEEYWTITAEFNGDKPFSAKLAGRNGKKITIGSKEENDAILRELEANSFLVDKVEEKDRSRKAAPPFTTSSLQQDAANKLNFSTRKTMMVAQQLYEGIEIKGMGTVGLVSYIRTDSVRISQEARSAAREYIIENIGEEYYGDNVYSNRKKDVQDAHEAIRPSNVQLTPDSIKNQLSKDQYSLYRLIWNRFIASQMSAARYKAVTADILNGEYNFRANGSKLLFDGYLKVYDSAKNEDENRWLPQLEKGEVLHAKEVLGEQSFTQPPPRFTEASLVKDLEEKDIGRPSTYAPIVATLIDRRYIKKEKKTLIPTDLGFTVIAFLSLSSQS